MTASPKSAKCVQCNAPVVGNDLLCRSCQTPKSSGKPGGGSSPNVSQSGPVPTPSPTPNANPSKKRALSAMTLPSAAFILLCAAGGASYIVGLRRQHDAARQDGALDRTRQQGSGGRIPAKKSRRPQSGSGHMAAGTFVFVDAAAASTDTLDFKEIGSYLQTIQQGQGYRYSRGTYGMNAQQITLQDDTGNRYTGYIHGDIITMNWGARSLEYARVGTQSNGQTPPIASSGDRWQTDSADQTSDTSSQQPSSRTSAHHGPFPSNDVDDYIQAVGHEVAQASTSAVVEHARLMREKVARGVNAKQRAGAMMNITPYLQELDRDAAAIQQNMPYASVTGKRDAQYWLRRIQQMEAELRQYKRDAIGPSDRGEDGKAIVNPGPWQGLGAGGQNP